MILLEQVGFTYADGAVGLQDVSFAVPTGELVALLQPRHFADLDWRAPTTG